MIKVLNVKCPQCKLQFNYYSVESRPFCSKRCREIDLGMWLTESYTVASDSPLTDQDMELVVENLEKDNGNSDDENY